LGPAAWPPSRRPPPAAPPRSRPPHRRPVVVGRRRLAARARGAASPGCLGKAVTRTLRPLANRPLMLRTSVRCATAVGNLARPGVGPADRGAAGAVVPAKFSVAVRAHVKTPRNPVRLTGGRTRLLPAEDPWGSSAPRNSRGRPKPRRESPVLTTRGPLEPCRCCGRLRVPTAQRRAFRTRQPFRQELQSRISQSNRVGPSGRSGI
jgi:hypothetical protein